MINRVTVTESWYRTLHTLTEPELSQQRSLPHLTIASKPRSTEKLFRLSSQLQRIQKRGLKALIREKEEALMGSRLKETLQGQGSQYLRQIIPNIIKMTRQPGIGSDLGSRIERGKAYCVKITKHHRKVSMLENPQ